MRVVRLLQPHNVGTSVVSEYGLEEGVPGEAKQEVAKLPVSDPDEGAPSRLVHWKHLKGFGQERVEEVLGVASVRLEKLKPDSSSFRGALCSDSGVGTSFDVSSALLTSGTRRC